ncbi:MAG: sigma-70 family RNA polymerase sigma factor [Eubacteriales bacterium]|nr:sigma-70 family RNA polymerase sigma factor [Eubacteriales bacterium]
MQLPEIQNYTEYLFRAAMKKCGNLNDAEDLTQEVLLAALQYPKEIMDIKSWLSMVLNHKYYDMLRRKYKLPTVSIDLVPEEAEPWETSEIDDRPDATSVRREVAYLADKYRMVIVRHYLNGEKVQDIADSLGVPKGTVLSRLSGGRELMRRGFDEMKSYEKQSYQPERLDIGCHGSQGFHNEPWSLVANDLIKQNILIVAYNEPLTVVEIARALGIPTAYVESAVRDLAESELMKQVGNKYFTDFMITKPEQLLKGLDAEISLTDTHYAEILKNVNEYLKDLRAPEFLSQLVEVKRNKLEYYFILHLFSSALYTATQRIVPSKEEYPQRPDGGRWIANGNQFPLDFDFDTYRFRKYCYGGERRSYDENYLGSKSIHLHLYDTQPDLNKYEHGPVEMHDDTLVKLLYIISRGIPFEHTGFETMYLEDIPHLTECGILGSVDGKPLVNLPMMTPDEYNMLDKIRIEHMYRMADLFEPWLRKIFPHLKIDIPKHLAGRVAEFRQYSCYAIPMAFMKKAIAEGDFDAKDATPPMVFVVDDQNKNLR